MDSLRDKLHNLINEKRSGRYSVKPLSKIDALKEPSDDDIMAYKLSGGNMLTYMKMLDSSLYDIMMFQLIIKQKETEDE